MAGVVTNAQRRALAVMTILEDTADGRVGLAVQDVVFGFVGKCSGCTVAHDMLVPAVGCRRGRFIDLRLAALRHGADMKGILMMMVQVVFWFLAQYINHRLALLEGTASGAGTGDCIGSEAGRVVVHSLLLLLMLKARAFVAGRRRQQ